MTMGGEEKKEEEKEREHALENRLTTFDDDDDEKAEQMFDISEGIKSSIRWEGSSLPALPDTYN